MDSWSAVPIFKPRATFPYNLKSPWPEGEACVVLRSIALKATASMTRLTSESWFFLGLPAVNSRESEAETEKSVQSSRPSCR